MRRRPSPFHYRAPAFSQHPVLPHTLSSPPHVRGRLRGPSPTKRRARARPTHTRLVASPPPAAHAPPRPVVLRRAPAAAGEMRGGGRGQGRRDSIETPERTTPRVVNGAVRARRGRESAGEGEEGREGKRVCRRISLGVPTPAGERGRERVGQAGEDGGGGEVGRDETLRIESFGESPEESPLGAQPLGELASQGSVVRFEGCAPVSQAELDVAGESQEVVIESEEGVLCGRSGEEVGGKGGWDFRRVAGEADAVDVAITERESPGGQAEESPVVCSNVVVSKRLQASPSLSGDVFSCQMTLDVCPVFTPEATLLCQQAAPAGAVRPQGAMRQSVSPVECGARDSSGVPREEPCDASEKHSCLNATSSQHQVIAPAVAPSCDGRDGNSAPIQKRQSCSEIDLKAHESLTFSASGDRFSCAEPLEFRFPTPSATTKAAVASPPSVEERQKIASAEPAESPEPSHPDSEDTAGVDASLDRKLALIGAQLSAAAKRKSRARPPVYVAPSPSPGKESCAFREIETRASSPRYVKISQTPTSDMLSSSAGKEDVGDSRTPEQPRVLPVGPTRAGVEEVPEGQVSDEREDERRTPYQHPSVFSSGSSINLDKRASISGGNPAKPNDDVENPQRRSRRSTRHSGAAVVYVVKAMNGKGKDDASSASTVSPVEGAGGDWAGEEEESSHDTSGESEMEDGKAGCHDLENASSDEDDDEGDDRNSYCISPIRVARHAPRFLDSDDDDDDCD